MVENNKFNTQIKKNIFYVYLSQAISMIIGIVFTLILPKYLGVDEFGYWQLMILYINYLGIFYLGLNDGYYITFGGEEIDKLDKSKLKSQILLFFIIHVLISILLFSIILKTVVDNNIKFVLLIVVSFLPFFNMKGFLSQVFQATNQVRTYSLSIIIEKILVLGFIAFLILFKTPNFKLYLITYIMAGIISLIYLITKSYKIFLSKIDYSKKIFLDSFYYIKMGFPLMLSSLVGMLIIGLSKQMIEIKWGIETFSLVSMSISLVNLFLVFVNSSSLALFPSLRTLENEQLEFWYDNIRKILNVLLPVFIIFYYPLSIFIRSWLPNYNDTVYYLAFLFPIIIFEIKNSILGMTFFKVLKKQKWLFLINLFTLVTNVILSVISIFVFDSIELALISISLSLTFRSLVSEYIIIKQFNISYGYRNILLVIISVLFMVINISNKFEFGNLILSVSIIVYLILNINIIKKAFIDLKNIN